MGRLVRCGSGDESGIPVSAEYHAGRLGGGCEPEYLQQTLRPCEDGLHRPDGERAAVRDPDRGEEDAPDPYLSCVPYVQKASGRRPGGEQPLRRAKRGSGEL